MFYGRRPLFFSGGFGFVFSLFLLLLFQFLQALLRRRRGLRLRCRWWTDVNAVRLHAGRETFARAAPLHLAGIRRLFLDRVTDDEARVMLESVEPDLDPAHPLREAIEAATTELLPANAKDLFP